MPEISRPVMMAGAAAIALILIVVAALAFLGGDGTPGPDVAIAAIDQSTDPAPELSKRQQFIHDADQICADIMTKGNQLPTPTTLEEAVAVMERVRAIIMDARTAGAKLDVPKDARKGWVRMMGTDEDVAEFDAVMAALSRGDVSALQTWERENKGSAARDRRWAKRYGMAVCSQKLS